MAKKTQAEIEFKVIDDGLKSELKAISGEMTKSRQEMKLSQEQLKQTGSETDKLESSLSHLKEQYAQQTKVVQTVGQQLENAQKYYGENSAEAAKYEKQLRSAEIYQQQLSNRIEDTSKALSAAKGDMSTYSGAMAKIGQEQKRLSAEQAASTAEYKKWQATAGQSATEAEKLAKAQEYAGQQSKIASNQIDLLKQSLDVTQKEFGETSTEAMQMKAKLADAETAFAKLGDAADEVDGTSLDDIGSKIDTGNIMEATEQIGALGDKLKEIGGEAVEMANGISNASFKVANGSQKMGLSMADAEKHIVGIADTGVGSIEDVGEAVSIAANQVQGLNETDLDMLAESGMNLDKIFGSDMDETMRGVDGLMKNFGLSAKDAMNLMVAGTQQGLDKTHELGDNMAEYSQIWGQMGFSAKDTFAILDNGLKSGAYNLDKVNDFAKEFGVAINDGRIKDNIGEFSKGTQDLFQKYQQGKATTSDVFKSLITDLGKTKDKQKALSTASSIWSSLGEDNALKVITGLTKTNHAFDNTSGAADKLNKKARENNAWQASLAQMKNALIPIGETIKDTLQPVLEFVAKAAKGFTSLPGPVKEFIVALGLAITVVTPLVGLFAAVKVAVVALGGPATWAILAIVAAVTAVIMAVKNWGAVVAWLKGVWSDIVEWFSGLWDGIKQGASSLWDGVQEAWSAAVEAVKGVWGGITEFFSELWQSIVDTVSPIFETIGNIFTVGLMTIQSIVQGIWTVISSVFKAGVDIIVAIFKGLLTSWQNVWNSIKTFVQPVVNAIKNFLTTTWNAIKTTTQTVWNAIKNIFTTVWNGIKAFITPVVNGIKSAITNAWNGIKSPSLQFKCNTLTTRPKRP